MIQAQNRPKNPVEVTPNPEKIKTTPRFSLSVNLLRKGAWLVKLSCTLTHLPSGQWWARHTSADLGTVDVSSPFREAALTKLRNELQHRVELCPCSGAWGVVVELSVGESSSKKLAE